MSHFDEILREGQSGIHHHYHQNEELYDKSTNQSNLMATANDHMPSPFDSSPKAPMYFFSMNSPRHPNDHFQFNHSNTHHSKNPKDIFQPINRRLQFSEDANLFDEEQELQDDHPSLKQEEQWNFSSSETPRKNKRIRKCKNSKGLKNLSIGVYDIVAEKSQTTYKEVANCLIEKISRKNMDEQNQDSGFQNLRKLQKDEHNIKRRVYDALNVLISAQLLRKDGKKVICNCNLKQQHSNKQFLEEQKGKFQSELALKQQILAQKRNKLYRLENQQQKLKRLFAKNKAIGPKPLNSITLPFVAVKSNAEDVGRMDLAKREVLIEFKGNAMIMGDVDTLCQVENDQERAQFSR